MTMVVTIATLVWSPVAWGQEPSETLAVYMDAAVRNNPRVAVASAATASARADLAESGGALLPTLRANGSYTYNQYEAIAFIPDPTGGPPAEILIVPQDQVSASLSARLPLIDLPALATWQAAQDGVHASTSDEEAVMNDLRLEVARAWYAAIAAREVVVAAQRAKAAAEENRRVVSIRAAAGAATELGVRRAELEVANADQLLIEGERVRRVSLRTLATLSGLPEPEDLGSAPLAIPVLPSYDEVEQAADSLRPEIAAAEFRVDQLRLARSGAWLSYTPTLAATASETYTNASGFSGEETFWTVGLEADWLLLDFGDRGADVRRARAALQSAEAELARTRDQVHDEVYAALLDVEATAARLEAARRASEVALATAREFAARFQVGTATQFDVIQGDRDALEAEVRRIRAEGELAIAALALQRATGRPIEP